MGIVDLIFPKYCIDCGEEGEYICKSCLQKLVRPFSICPTCCKESIGGCIHPRCRHNGDIDRLVVGLPYKGLVQSLLKKVKYRSNWDIIAFLMQQTSFDLPDDCMVTYVPMWREKEKSRGFNQAEMMADYLVKNILKSSQNAKLIERARDTKPMYGLTKIERIKNIASAFKCVGTEIPRRVILCDDVWTSGSTMKECAKILKQNGVKEVVAVAIAR